MKPGVEDSVNWPNHRIRITLTSLNVKSLEKGMYEKVMLAIQNSNYIVAVSHSYFIIFYSYDDRLLLNKALFNFFSY